jgi:hypothetical protein
MNWYSLSSLKDGDYVGEWLTESYHIVMNGFTPNPTRIFLSYAHEDGREHVHLLHDALRNRGLDPWYDSRLNPSRAFEVEIEKEIKASQAVVVVHQS